MQDNDNIQTVRQIYRNFLDGNLDAVLDAFDENIDWDSRVNWPGGPTIRPYEGRRLGRDEVAAAFREFLSAVRYEHSMGATHCQAAGNRVIVTGQDIRRDLSNGELTENRWSMVWTLNGGKVVHFRIYQDTVPVLE